MYNPHTRVSEKCIGCYPAVEKGFQPMCVQNCIGRIRIMGFVNPPWKARENNPVDYLIHHAGLALPYYPQLGLEPNLYYIPPIHANPEYLQQMFGPNVHDAIERYKKIKNDKLVQGLLVLMGATDRIIHSFDVKGNMVRGFDEKGEELVSVPITEQVIERQDYNEKLGAIRQNTP
jgi:nitrate reductase / nitrite oxidoreductase, beta subunit